MNRLVVGETEQTAQLGVERIERVGVHMMP
jgi:hypothetical protein